MGSEKLARIWDAHSGDLVRVLRGHSRAIFSVVYSRDGSRIATSDVGGIVKVWEAQTGRLVHTLSDNCGAVWSVEFDSSGRQLVTADWDGPPRVWDVESGRLRFRLTEGKAGSYSARFSPDGLQIASLSFDRWLRIWDAATGRLGYRWQSRSRPSTSIGYSPDGLRLAVPVSDFDTPGADKGMIEIWDVAHGRQLLELRNHTEAPSTARFSPDGRRLLTTAVDFAARQEESFPWRDTEYASLPGTNLSERVRAYAREYWRARLVAEVPLNSVPRSSSKDSDHDLFPPRDPRAGSNLIDLSAHYTGLLDAIFYPTGYDFGLDDDLAALGTNTAAGLVTFGGVPFDVRGVVVLWRLDPGGRAFQKLWDHQPRSVQGIRIGCRVHRLQILQGVCGNPIVKDGTSIASFFWHYADGSHRETEVIYGRDVRDWWFGGSAVDPKRESERGRVVWTGDNPVAKKAGATLRLYLTPYENPQPNLEVTSIDFVSKMTQAAPFLVAMTLEP